MIRCIAAIDEKRGMANDHGIPWQGKIPTDVKQFREHTKQNVVLMGYATYLEFTQPLSERQNFVATTSPEMLRKGFTPVPDARKFLHDTKEDVWVIGGAGLFTSTLDLADELVLTHLSGDFQCTKFFPPYEDKFELVEKSDRITENGITYYFATYRRKPN